jgi:hypothetical protein
MVLLVTEAIEKERSEALIRFSNIICAHVVLSCISFMIIHESDCCL